VQALQILEKENSEQMKLQESSQAISQPPCVDSSVNKSEIIND
jgi:hypothetical protein